MSLPNMKKQKSGYYYRTRFTDSEGKKHQRYFSGFGTKKEAEAHYKKTSLEYEQGIKNETKINPGTFGEFIERWFNSSYKYSVAETTAYTNWSLIRRHILPYFSAYQLDQITSFMIVEFYASKLEGGLSPKTVREFHNILNRAFEEGVDLSVLEINPVKKAKPPKLHYKEHSVWTKKQTQKFLEGVEGTDNEVFYILAIFTGMRRGEILGLKWTDIDFEQGKIYVNRSLARVHGKGLVLKDVKTRRSRRQISISPYVILKLQEQKAKFNPLLNLNNEMVFTSSTGNYKDPNNVLREFNRLVRLADVPKITIHDLRHLHATMLLKNGENPKVVSERLGHHDVGITLDIYSHVTPDIQDLAATRLEQSYFSED